MKARGDRQPIISPKRAGLALLIVTLTVAAALAGLIFQQHQQAGGIDDTLRELTQPEKRHRLADAPNADFISVFVYRDNQQPSSTMVRSGTSQFDTLARALAGSRPVDGATDSSFDHLLVLSFGRGDTMEASYSPGRNLLMLAGQAWRPATDISATVEQIDHMLDGTGAQ